MFQHPNRIETTKNHFIISNYPGSILAFDRNGQLLNQIGRRGRGPGEYQFGRIFTLDPKKEYVYIYDNKTIIVYTFTGKYVKDFSIDEPQVWVGDVCFRDGKLYLAGGPRFEYDWVIYDTTGNVISYKHNRIPRFQSGWGSQMGFISSTEGLFYWNSV